MITKIKSFLHYMFALWRQPHWWAEQWGAAVILCWALFSLLGMPLDDRPGYAFMMRIAPGPLWGYLALAAGVFQLGALVVNNRWLRAIGAFMCAWFFSIVLLSLALENSFPPGMALYGGYIGINWMAMYKLLRGTA
jgi:hypothetical protein